MEKLFKIVTGMLISIIYATALSAADSTSIKLNLLKQFKSMYENKHFESSIFAANGYLQTSVADNENKMPSNFFINYNNIWWFPILYKVEVPAIGLDTSGDTGFIILNIYYDQTHLLRAMQDIKFKDNKIAFIRTYASPTFWDSDFSLIRLDSYGNQIWLTTGYDLDYSAKAAYLFLQSPVGQRFSQAHETAGIVKQIKTNLDSYLKKYR